MDIKFAPFRVKAVAEDGLEEGQFIGYASFFGNTDSYGDIVEPGAFKRTLAEWAAKDATIPVLWGHDMNDPFANIGGLVSAEEDENGLKVTGSLDLDNPTAQQVYRLMKGRRTNTMSFAYAVRDSKKADDGNHLLDLDLYEVSVVQVPANNLAEVLAVKSAAAILSKAGRVLSTKNETALREARDAIDSVLSSLGEVEDGKSAPVGGNQEANASGHTEAKDEEPVGAKSEEPRVNPSARALALEIQLRGL